jgi:pimeloyl-ACP methyl ester carboxylesterase
VTAAPGPSSGWDTSFVQVGDVRLHVRRQRAPGRPLLLLHGLGAGGIVWQSFARRLSPPWQCVAPDLRGHGESDYPIVGYEAEDYAGDVASLIQSVGAGPVPVVGHSLGALVAVALAANHPDLVRAAVLLDPPLDPDLENPDVAEVYRLRHAPSGELERYLSAPILAAVFRQAADAAFEAIMHAPRGARWAWDLAPSIRCPVLLVHADPARGGVLGPAASRDYNARLQRGEMYAIPGASHTVHVSHAAETAEAVLAFLARNAS